MNYPFLKEFIKILNRNAPLNCVKKTNNEFNNYKYPYKPILMLSILTKINDKFLFNQAIKIDKNYELLKTYYDLLTNCKVIYDFIITKSKHKQNWGLIYNEQVSKEIVQNILDNPAEHLVCDFFQFNRKEKTITLSIDDSHLKLGEIKNLLISESLKCLYKCVPDYKDLNINELLDYEYYMNVQLESFQDINSYKQSRQYQHLFRKKIFNRDKKCVICCLDLPELLQAAHIKPFANCTFIEQYDDNNGILLCCNHHKLFDLGFFTFNANATISISNELKNIDQDILLKTFEPCFNQNLLKFSFIKKYIEFHYNEIYRK